MSYTIIIDESQRQIITEALKHLPFAAVSHVKTQLFPETIEESVLVLKEMFEELEGTPSNIVNGFCL